MTWCRHVISHYLSKCWHRSMLPYGVTRPRCVETWVPCVMDRSVRFIFEQVIGWFWKQLPLTRKCLWQLDSADLWLWYHYLLNNHWDLHSLIRRSHFHEIFITWCNEKCHLTNSDAASGKKNFVKMTDSVSVLLLRLGVSTSHLHSMKQKLGT